MHDRRADAGTMQSVKLISWAAHPHRRTCSAAPCDGKSWPYWPLTEVFTPSRTNAGPVGGSFSRIAD